MSKVLADKTELPRTVDREEFHAELDTLRLREKAHTRESDAIAAARRRLPMVAVDGATPLVGERGAVTLLDAFEGRRLLIAYYFMWYDGRPAPEQCEGCTFFTTQVRELSHLHSRDVTYATFCQGMKSCCPPEATRNEVCPTVWPGVAMARTPRATSAPSLNCLMFFQVGKVD